MVIVIVLVLLFLIAFILAWRKLPELEVPDEVGRALATLSKKRSFWGVIVFFRDKIVHYSSTDSDSEVSSS